MYRNYAKCLYCALLPLAGISSANAEFFDHLKTTKLESTPMVQWQNFGPGMSGYIDKFWIHPADPNAMFTYLDMGNGHGTWDRGDSWGSYRDFDGTGKGEEGITAMEFSHQDPDFGIMVAKSGLYSTEDRGRSWEYLVDTDTTNSQKHNVLTVDPNNDNVWYIGAGRCWMIKESHFNKDGLQYVNTGNHSKGFILKSTDRGQTWTKITSVFPADADFSRIIVHPGNSNTVFASCQYGVYRSYNAGGTWEKVAGNGLPHHQPRDMAYHYDASSGEFWVYIVEVTHYTPNGNSIQTTGGVYRSSDGGYHWENLTGNLAIDLNEVNSWGYQQKYWSTIAHWLDISVTDAKDLYAQLPSSTFSQFNRLAVDPTNKDRIYLVHNFKHDYAFPPGNIWMTEDGGSNWYAAAREGPYWVNEVDRSYWQSRNQLLGANVQYAHVHKEHYDKDNTSTGPRFVMTNSLGEVYTAFAQQVMRSTDNGQTWNQIDDFETSPGSGNWVGRGNSNLPGETLYLETQTPGTYLFGSGEHGLWRNSDDGNLVYPGAIAVEQLTGQSRNSNDALSIGTIAVHPNNPNRLYTLQFRQNRKGELRHSSDNGDTWETLSTPVVFPATNDVIKMHSLLIDPDNPNNMYFCVPFSELTFWASGQWFVNGPETFSGYGVYKSSDGGSSWSFANSGLPADGSVYRLCFDPDNPKIIYAAMNKTHEGVSGGLYKSTNRGSSWSPVAIPSGVNCVNEVSFNKVTGDLYIACGSYANDGATGGAFVSRDDGANWELLFDMPNVRTVSSSVVDPNVIAVNVGQAQSIGHLNPGAYVSLNAGATWDKINSSHGQPARIRTVKTDPFDADILWATFNGTGFCKADLFYLSHTTTMQNFTAIQDADVKGGSSADSTFGTNTGVKMDPYTPRYAYLQFDVSGLGGSVVTARVMVHNHHNSPILGTVTAYEASNGWDQSTVTWNTKHDIGAELGSRRFTTESTWYDIDVTTAVTEEGLLTIALQTDQYGILHSTEYSNGAYAPYLEIITAEPKPMQFSGSQIQPYGGSQDGGGGKTTTAFISGGTKLTIKGNVWKGIAHDYDVTEQTMLEFEVKADDVGEITGIGFETDDSINNAKLTFQLAGTQTWNSAWQVANDYTVGSGWVTYSIPVGSYFTGAMSKLVFIGDDDKDGSSFIRFRNIKVYEGVIDN